jgi:hypothetical protein
MPEKPNAFGRLSGIAHRVARDLKKAGVAHDSYVAEPAGTVQVQVKRLFGTKTVDEYRAEQVVSIGGWRVLDQYEGEDEVLMSYQGNRSREFTYRTLEVWLRSDGMLEIAEILAFSVTNWKTFRQDPPKVKRSLMRASDAFRFDQASTFREWRRGDAARTESGRRRWYEDPRAETTTVLTAKLQELERRAN